MALPEKMIEGIERLEPLPASIRKLIAVVDREDTTIHQVADIVQNDPAVTSNVLRVANSGALGGRTRIDSLHAAVVRLGMNGLLDVALGGQLESMVTSAPLYDLDEDELWLHAVAAAVAVQRLRAECKDVAIPPSASVAALVHDIGKLVMARFCDGSTAELLEYCEQHNVPFVVAERKLYCCDHAEVGGAIARAWEFPEPIVTAIECHHRIPVEEPTPLLDAVMLANLATKCAGVGLGAEGLNLQADYGALKRLGLGFDAFCRVCADTATEAAQLRAASERD